MTTTENEKSPATEQASEAADQRPSTENATAESIGDARAADGNGTSSKVGRADALPLEITEQMAAEWADRNELENVLTSFSTQRNAIEDARTLHLITASPVEQPAAAPIDLPDPKCTFADHSARAYTKQQMLDYGRECAATADDILAHIKWMHYCLREAGHCIDGGKCHHECGPKGECWRQHGCVPLTGSRLTDDWKLPAPSSTCKRCGSTTAQACNDVGCFYLESGDGEPAPSPADERAAYNEAMADECPEFQRPTYTANDVYLNVRAVARSMWLAGIAYARSSANETGAEGAKWAKSISDEMMDLVDRLGSEWDKVDPRAWRHLLVYAPKPKETHTPEGISDEHLWEIAKKCGQNTGYSTIELQRSIIGYARVVLADKAIHEAFIRTNKLYAAPEPAQADARDDTHLFKNFHRQLCERFGYVHDEIDWRRDQVSLIEWIANKADARDALTPDEWKSIRTLKGYVEDRAGLIARESALDLALDCVGRLLAAHPGQPEPAASPGVIAAALAVIEADRSQTLTNELVDALDIAIKIQRGMFKLPEPHAEVTEEQPSLTNPLTPYGMLVRALRIVSGTTLMDMAKALLTTPAKLSATEFGRAPITLDFALDVAAYFDALGVPDTLVAIRRAIDAARTGGQ
ncbi:hypothetical protein [Burkholderia cepacia]|uniref:hypothetical protein n=1 Tax=Burkholderia cepacia TaxID=292 RepID=UPI0021AB41AD|nr:hypothetical protein [Burkholderia cepacia]